MKKAHKARTRTVVVDWDSGFRDKLAKIVSDIINAPKGTPVSGSTPIQGDR